MLFAPAVAEEAGKWRYAMWPLAWYFTSVWDPVRYVGQIAPRPVLIQNGNADTVIPERCARALQEATREPKTVKWYKGDHLGKTSDLDFPLVTAVLADALVFIQEQDAKVVAANQAFPGLWDATTLPPLRTIARNAIRPNALPG